MKRAFRTAIYVIVFIAAALLMSGCDIFKRGGGTSPSPNPGPSPDQGLYPPLPHRENPINAQGNKIESMWVQLDSVKPLRGSSVVVGPQFCPDGGCWEATLRFYFRGIDNPVVGMSYDLYFSMDGINNIGEPLRSSGVPIEEAKNPEGAVRTFGPWIFNGVAPKYSLVKLRHSAGGGGNAEYKDPAEEGWTKFFLDYSPK